MPFNPGNLFFRVVDKGIPSEVKAIVGGDARKPFLIRSATLRKGASANGNAFIEAVLEPGQNPPSNFSLLQDGEVVTLRDDGLEGDAKAGDGVFTGQNMPKLDPADHVTPRIFADLKRREDDLLKLIIEPCFFQLFREPAGFTH